MLLLVTGASGAGKSTVRTLVESRLAPAVECVELQHLAQVPPTSMTLAWRQKAAEVAVRRAIELRTSGRHLLLSGDPVAAAEIAAAPSAPDIDAIAVCLLDVSPEAQAARLAERGDPPELLPHHHAFAEWMRRQAADPLHMPHVMTNDGWADMRWERLQKLAPNWHVQTVDTTDMTRTEVADAVLRWCQHALTGDVSLPPIERP
jgi:broad-specificity NMP kinase